MAPDHSIFVALVLCLLLSPCLSQGPNLILNRGAENVDGPFTHWTISVILLASSSLSSLLALFCEKSDLLLSEFLFSSSHFHFCFGLSTAAASFFFLSLSLCDHSLLLLIALVRNVGKHRSKFHPHPEPRSTFSLSLSSFPSFLSLFHRFRLFSSISH